mmetsp:Transcript_10291/g.15110  ORF Transcript_10291/g.15110 Transcript_10291/m.15110 type:complete len:87 (+) Transcript_10291:150-410(+)
MVSFLALKNGATIFVLVNAMMVKPGLSAVDVNRPRNVGRNKSFFFQFKNRASSTISVILRFVTIEKKILIKNPPHRNIDHSLERDR